jgi:hypothetical protein
MFKSRLLQLVDLLVIFAFTAYVAIPQETEPRPSPAADLGRRSPGPVTPAPAAQLARALGAFGQLQAGQPGATPADVAALTQKLGTAEEQGHSGFAEVERHLRAQALPRELLQRHRQAVDLHRARLADVRTRLADAEAEGDEDARRRKLEEAGRLLVGAPPRKGHDALDPARLPVRAASAKVRPPRTTPAELDADLEVVPATVARALTATAAQAPTAADLRPPTWPPPRTSS